MYRPDQPAQRPPFGAAPLRSPHFRPSGSCPSPPFLFSMPPRGHFLKPHSSNFSMDHSTVVGNHQIVPLAGLQHHQVPQWNPRAVEHHPKDTSDQAGEEFLRCLAANKPLPDYLKGNMTYNLADAFKSAKDLKQAVKGDLQFQKLAARNRSRSRSRSRGRSRGRSRAKSLARSRSKRRSKSRVHGRSRSRSKSRARCRSQSWSKKSHKRSKSKLPKSKSRSSSRENSSSIEKKRKRNPGPCINSSLSSRTNSFLGNSLLEELKMVMNKKDLDECLPALKDAILGIQALDETIKEGSDSSKQNIQKQDNQDNMSSLESDSTLLPHERVGRDFAWLKDKSQEDMSFQKANDLEDEESFLYGVEASQNRGHVKVEKTNSSSVGVHQNISLCNLVTPKALQQMPLSAFSSVSLDSLECEKIKNILSSLDGKSDVGKVLLQTQRERQDNDLCPSRFSSDTEASTLNDPNIRKALESLRSLIEATKEKRTQSIDQSQSSSDKQKAGEHEEKKRTKMRQMELMAKEMEELLRHQGLSFISPVVGFYCQKCQEFIGDLNSAESHATIHQSTKHVSKGLSSTSSQCSHSTSRSDRDLQRNWSEEQHHRSTHHGSRSVQGNLCLKDEMKKERMLITLSRGITTPPQSVSVKQEGKELVKGKDKKYSSNKSSKNNKKKHKVEKSGSNDSSEDDKPSKKHSKKKRKKKKRRKD